MIRGIVKFWDLGRGKANGTFKVECDTPEEFNDKLYREFSKHLMSSGISFDGDTGSIFAGFHKVGNFTFVAQEEVV